MKIRSFFTNSSGILFSRIFGFIRDLLMAYIVGANVYSDIFFVAFKLPNLFRRVFGEGAFAQSFLPSFIASRYKSIFAIKIIVYFTLFIILLSIVVSIFAPLVTTIIAPGLSDMAKAEASEFVAIQFWYLPLIFLVTALGALLQYREHFATTAFATVLLNIALIGGLLYAKGKEPHTIITILSISVLIGGVLQLVVHLMVAYRFGLLKMLYIGYKSLKKHSYKIKEDTNRFFKNFFPAIWGNSTAQVMAFMDTWLASFLISGSISYLYYANRIFQLPLAVFAIALSVAIFPSIAKLLNSNKEKEAIGELKKGFWILLFLLSVATLGGVIFSKEIIWLLFQRGAFEFDDTIMTASVLQAYMIGLLPFGLSKLFSLWLYSNHQQLKAAKIATWALGGYIVSALLLIDSFGVVGLAFAGTISGFISFVLLLKSFEFGKFLMIIDKRYILVYLLSMLVVFIVFMVLHNFLIGYIN